MKLKPQTGASLIEVLIAIFLLSVGMLALGAMLSFAVQMPKIAGYRATATNLASSYVERMRANPEGFSGGYDNPINYDNKTDKLSINADKACGFTGSKANPSNKPICTSETLASMDFDEIKVAVRAELPAGGLFMLRDNSSGIVSTSVGNLWIIWNEPSTNAGFLESSVVDNCPIEITGTYTDPKPRCLYLRFAL